MFAQKKKEAKQAVSSLVSHKSACWECGGSYGDSNDFTKCDRCQHRCHSRCFAGSVDRMQQDEKLALQTQHQKGSDSEATESDEDEEVISHSLMYMYIFVVLISPQILFVNIMTLCIFYIDVGGEEEEQQKEGGSAGTYLTDHERPQSKSPTLS